ncbi:MAG: o-succinylbenzoate synthase [Gemmatimonadales bacterium]|nr:o-succinylbenzoate synthase [Gemmatimonadota bacterium]MCL4214968.1 o-succinylbenzoate synthase [Gemmatimonadales bacterium]
MIHLDRIVLREIRLPLREPFRISSGEMTERRILLCELFDADGASTWSECVVDDAPNYSPETLDTAWPTITRFLAPRLLGRRVETPGEVFALLEQDVRGHNMAKAALEMGCWAIAAEQAGMPLARLIGGTRERIATGISLGIQRDVHALIAKAEEALAAGYQKVKIKIAPGRDVDWVRAVRTAVGHDAHLMADANNAYTLADTDRLLALDDLGLMMIEQPLAWDDLVRHAELQRKLRTPLCLDESIVSLERAQDMVTLEAGRIVNIKPGRVGGFTASLRIHDYCESVGVPVWCGGMLESGIGRAYNVALASLPNFTLPGDLSPSARYWAQDVVTPEWTMDAEGMVQVPLGMSGIGVTVDRKRIESLTVRAEELRAR